MYILGADGTDGKYISISFNGTSVTRSQGDGTFQFQLPSDVTRLTLLLKDDIYKKYLDTLYVVTVSTESSENVYATIRMLTKGAEIQVSSSEESETAVTSPETGKTIAEVIIPADAVYTPDGEPYTVRASKIL